MAGGGFTTLEFNGLPTVVYREDPHEGVFTETPNTVTQARAALTSLRRQALDTQDSRVLIQDLAREYDPGQLAELLDDEI